MEQLSIAPPPPPTQGRDGVMVAHSRVGERTASPVGQYRGFPILLRLLLLLLVQQTFPLAGRWVDPTAMLKASTAVVGFLLAPQEVQAQSYKPVLTATGGYGSVMLSWTRRVDPNDSNSWVYRQKTTGNWGEWIIIPGASPVKFHSTGSYTVVGLTNDTRYTFQIGRGNISNGRVNTVYTGGGGYSNEATATPTIPPGTVSVTATPGDGRVNISASISDLSNAVSYWSIRWVVDSNTTPWYRVWASTPDLSYAPGGALAYGADRHSLRFALSATNGKKYSYQLVAHESNTGTQYTNVENNMGWATATPRADTPTLTSDPDKTVTVGSADATTNECFNLLSVKQVRGSDTLIWLQQRTGGNSYINRLGNLEGNNRVEITQAPAGITTGLGANLFPCATLGVGTHTVTWSWKGRDGSAVAGTTSTTITVTETAPAAPTGLSATAGDAQVTLSWTKPAGSITGYKLRYGKTGARGSATWAVMTSSGASTETHTVTELDNGAEYSFMIRAVNAAGDGTATDWVTATLAAPAVVTAATSTASGWIDVRWTHASTSVGDQVPNGVTFYAWRVAHRLKGSSTWEEGGSPSGASSPSRRHRRVGTGSTYPNGASVEVRIRAAASNASGSLVYGPWSNIRTATFKNDDTAALTITGAPVTVEAGSSASYTVALTKAYAGTLSITSSAMAKATVDPATLTFTTGNYNTAQAVTVTGVEAGTATINHAFRLTGATADAIPDAGAVAVTVNAVVSVPAKPTGLSGETGNAQVTLTWTDPDNDSITKYQVQQKKGPAAWGGWADISGSDADTVSHTVTGLENDAEYRFRIRAVNNGGNSAASDAIVVTPRSKTITLSATSTSITEGNSGSTAVTVTFMLSEAAPASFSVSTFGGGTAAGSNKGNDQCTAPLRPADTDWCWTDNNDAVSIAAGETTGTRTLRIIGDTRNEPNETIELQGFQAGWNSGRLTLTITDDDDPPATAGVTLSKTSLTVEEGSSDTYTVKLDKAPTANVTITVSGASGDVSVMSSPLTFTPGNFGTVQIITVNAARDGDATDDTATLTHAASSTDTSYGASLEIDDVDVTVTDTTPTFQLLTDPAAVTEGTDISLTVTSDRSISGNWPVRLTLAARSSSAFTAADIAGTLGPREFTANFGSTSASTTGTVTIPTSTDSATEGAEAYRITLSERTTNVTYAIGTDATADGTLNDGTVATPKPAAPTGLSATAGNGQVELTWTDPEDDSITKYQLRQKKGSTAWGGWTGISGTDADTVSHTVTGLDNDVEYSFRIRARNSGGNGAQSAVVEATPAAAAAVPKPVLSAEAGYARVTLSWSALSGVTVASWGYQYKSAGGSWSSTTTVTGGSTTSATVTGLTIGTEYRFRLSAAVSPGVQSVWSDEVKATPTNTVPKPVLTAVGGDRSVTLSWSGLSGIPITSWGYQYKSSGGWSTTMTLTGGSRTSATVTGLTGGTEYTFRLFAAVSPGVQSVWSDEVTAKTVGVVVSKSALTVAEGASGSYTVKLSTAPSADVTVTVGGASGDVTVNPPSLTFTTGNYSTVQSVAVSAAQDLDGDTDPDVTLTHSASGGGYGSVSIDNVVVTVTEDDTKGVTVSSGTLTVDEGGTGSYTLVLDTQPSGEVVVTVGGASGDVTVPDSQLRFALNNWSTAQTVTVNAALDPDADTDPDVTLTHSASGGGYGSVSIDNVVVSVTEAVSLPTAPTGFAAAAGNGQVVLSWSDPSDASITGYELSHGKTGERGSAAWTAIPAAGATTVTHTVTSLDNGSEYSFRLRAVNPAGNGAETSWVTATPLTPTVPGVTVSTAALKVAEGGSGTYTVRLDTVPSDDVTMTVAGASGDVTVAGSPVIFSPSNWDTAKTVTVKAGTDEDTDDDSATLTHAASGSATGYDSSLEIDDVRVSVTDITPTLQLLTNPAAVREGENISLTVTSDKDVTGDLPVNLTLEDPGSSGFTAADIDGTLGPRNFTASFGVSASKTGRVSIATSRDGVVESAENYRITLNDGPGYKPGADKQADGTLNDGTTSLSIADVSQAEDGTFSFTVTASPPPSAPVTFKYKVTAESGDTAIAGTDFTEVSTATAKTIAANASGTTITVSVTDDDLDESDETFTVTLSEPSAGAVLGDATATGTITDNDESPELDAIADQTIKLGQAVAITALATDGDGDTVTYAWTRKSGETTPALPVGTARNQAQLTFPTTAVGTYSMTVTANDGNGNTDTEEVVITVTNEDIVSVPGNLVVAESVGNATVRITTTTAFGKALTFNITYGGSEAMGDGTPANGDYDNDAVTTVDFSSTDTSKDIAIPVTDDDLDENDETFTVSIALAPGNTLPDDFTLGNTTTTVSITDDDESPVLTEITDQTISQGEVVDITASATDGDGDTLTYIWTRKAGESTPSLPVGTVLNQARLRFTPPATATGTYTMAVTASDGNGNRDTEEVVITVSAPVATVPGKPTGLTATRSGDGEVRLSWTKPTGPITSYEVRYGKTDNRDSATWTAIASSDATTVSHRVENLDSGSEYSFQVRAINDAGDGIATDWVTATLQSSTAGVTVSPTTLSLREGGTTGSYTVVLNTDPSATVTVTPTSRDSIAVTVSAALSFTPSNWDTAQTVTVTPLQDEDATDENITVSHDISGYSGVSNVDGVTVTVTDTTPTLQLLDDPTGVSEGTAISLTVTSDKARTGDLPVMLTLAARSASGFDADDIEGPLGPRSFSASFGESASTSGTVSIPTSADAVVEGGEAYRITLSDGSGYAVGDDTTADGTINDATPPAQPAGFTATAGDGMVTLGWQDPDNDSITVYQLRQKRGSAAWGGWGEISGSGATTTRHIVTNLDNEVEYSFRIRARNSGGESDESAVATATPTDAISTGPVLQLLNNPAAVREGEAIRLTVTADREQTGRLPLSLTLSARSSSFNANDISGALGPRTFNADFGGSGRTTGTVTISTRRDSLVEGAEAYRITLNPAAGYTVGDASTADGRLNDGTIPSVTVFPTALTVVEGGSTTYTVRLNNQPSADVTITVGGASGDVSVTDSSLIFTPANYRRAQTVTVNAASDEDTTNDRATLTHSANGGGYNSARINNVRVSVTDTTERTPVFQLRTDPAPVREGEAIRLIITASRTVIGNRSVSLTLSPRSGSSFDADDIEGTLGPGNFTASFAASPGSTSGTVIIPSRSDALVEGDEAYRITLNSGSGYELGTDTTADGTINDGTIPGVTVSPTALTMAEGGSGTYTVRLDNQPSGNVTITVGGASGDVTVAGSPLIFTSANYSRAQTVTVNAAADEDTANDRATLTHSANGGGYHSVSIDSVSVTVTDTTPVFQLRNDPAPVREGEAIRLTITANRTVVGNRSVSLTLSPRSGSSFDANDIEGMPGPGNFTVSFAASPGSTSGTVIIPTRNDTVVEGAEHYRITLNDGSGYALGTDTTADGTINDGTTGSVTVSPTALTVAEGGSTTYTVRLDNQPSAEVTITVGGASGDVTVADSSLTFTPANYSRVQTVTVNAAADEDATDDSATLIHSASGGGYNSVSIDPVIVTVDDDDTAGVTVSPTTLPMHEGRSGQYTVKLDTEPSGTVTITPTTGDSRAVMVSAALTFTTANWKTPQTVMVSTSQDADAKDETVTVRHAVTGYGAVTTAAPVTVEVTDDETEHLGQPEARKEELVGLSRATLGMATDMIGARIAGDLPGNGAGAGSIGDQAWAMMGNLLGFSHGSELSTNLSLEQLEEQLWRQSFHISQTDRETDQQGWHAAGEQQGSWSLWGAGELRSFKGDDASDAENHSYSGSIKAGWLGIDYQFTNAWLAGLAVSFSSSESHYTYRSEGGMGAGETETQLTTFLPYGSLQLTERLQLWGTAGIGFGDLRHQSSDDDDDSEAQGALKVHLAAIGFEQKLSSLSSWNAFSLAGDLAVVQSSTEWQDNALNDQSVSITRARLGVNSSFPLSQTTTGYMTLRGRLDGGDLQMGAAEMLLGLRYSTGRFSALLQGRQTSALDGSYSESGILGQLRFSSQQDGTGLAFQLQPSFGPYGEVGSEQASLWNDQQLDALTGWNGNGQQGAAMALKSTIGYGFLLPDSNLLLTPFAEAAFTQATSHQIGLGISMEGPSWQVKLSGSREESSNSAPTGTLKLMFSKQL